MESIPHELITEIITFVDPDDKLSLVLINKLWHRIVLSNNKPITGVMELRATVKCGDILSLTRSVIKDDWLNIALEVAARHGQISIVRLLIKRMKQVQNYRMSHALFKAFKGGHLTVDLLIANNSVWLKYETLCGACAGGREYLVRFALSQFVDEELPDVTKIRAVYYAYSSGNANIISFLQAKGFKLNQYTILGAAAGNHWSLFYDELIAIPDIQMRERLLEMSYVIAFRKGYDEFITNLFQLHKATPWLILWDNCLIQSIVGRHLQLIKLCIQNGAGTANIDIGLCHDMKDNLEVVQYILELMEDDTAIIIEHLLDSAVTLGYHKLVKYYSDWLRSYNDLIPLELL